MTYIRFCDYWMNEDPFGEDMKSLRTHWHEAPITFPTRKDTILWQMDDWRTMVTQLKSKIYSWKSSMKTHDYIVTVYISEDQKLSYQYLVQDVDATSVAIDNAITAIEGHGVKTYGIKDCEIFYPF